MKLRMIMAAFAMAGLAACNNDSETASNKSDSSATTTETSTSGSSTTTTAVAVPSATKTSFESKYPNASSVTWAHYGTDVPIEWTLIGWPSLDENDYVATFNMDNSNYWVWYDDSGNWVGTVSDVSATGLPSAVTNVIKTQYPNYNLVSAKKENDKDRTAYEVKLESGQDKVTLLVDENGKIMKKKANVAGEKTKEKPVKDSMK